MRCGSSSKSTTWFSSSNPHWTTSGLGSPNPWWSMPRVGTPTLDSFSMSCSTSQLKRAGKGDSALAALYQHPWHRREFGSHLTNVIRVLALESLGYQVTVTELTGWEHSLKNELIMARRIHREDPGARQQLSALLSATGVNPKLTRKLQLGN